MNNLALRVDVLTKQYGVGAHREQYFAFRDAVSHIVPGKSVELQIRKAVTLVNAMLFLVNAMLFKEGMNLHSGVIAEQVPQLCSRKLIFTVGFKRDRFEDGTCEILAGGSR